jgi:hypothetical protein
MVAWQLAEISP